MNVYIYDKHINERDYISLIEFSHFLNYYDNLTVIMEFTSINRLDYLSRENINNKMYITYSNCLADTKNILYNPIIKKKKNIIFLELRKMKIYMNFIKKLIVYLKKNSLKK